MINEKRSEFQILKNRIENYKKRKNKIKRKNLFMKPNQEKNLALKRPYSNYIRNNNKILEKGNVNNNLCYSQIRKPNKVVINKLINCSDIGDNSLSFVKIKHQKKYFKNNIFNESNRKELNNEYNLPKSAKAELKIRKSFLFDNKLFNNVNTNISKRAIRGSLSNRNNYHKNKYLEITRELFSEKKRSKVYATPNSPSTTNNSNINDNSYSSHFLFGISSLNSNIYPKAIQNNFIIENLFNNKESNNKINLENNKIKTSVENNINKILSKNESFTANKNLLKNTQNFNLDDFYFHYSIFNYENEEEPIINIPIKSKNRNKIKNEEIICNNTINLVKSKNIINRNNNINKIKKSKNKIPNLIIKYTFLNNEFQKIKRKVDFINPKNGEQIKLDTANVDNNNSNKINYKKEDFKTYGYEMTPEELYKIYQKNNQKRMIKIRKEKNENKNYKENEDNKKIYPKYFIFHRNNNMKNKIEKNQKYWKINAKNKNVNKMNNKKQIEENNNKKEIGNDTNDLLNIYSFGLGESLYKNKLDYNLINEADKEDGKKLWSKLNKNKNKSSINMHSKINKKTEERISYKNKNMIKKRIKSAKIYKTIHINKSIKKEKPTLINNEIEKVNEKEKNITNSNIFVRKMMKKNFTQEIDTLEQHKLFRNEKGFEEIKNMNDNIYNIDFRITDEDEEKEYTIDKIIEKENEEIEEKDSVESYILNNNKNISKRRNTTADIGKFSNKFYKVKKNSKKELNRSNKNKINSNNNIEKIKDKNKETKVKDKNKETKIKDKNKEIKIKDKLPRPNSKINYNNNVKKFRIKNNKKIFEKEKYKNKFKEKEVKIINKEKDENYFINFVKNKSVDIGENKILDELYTTSENLENEVNNLSTENALYTNHVNMEDIIKRQNQKKSNLIFDRIFKNYKYKYIEDEKMEKYFEQIFNKYAREENDEKFVDVKFFGYEFKIKQKNQNNFKNILMRNIRQQEKELKENQIMKSKLNLILNKFTKNKKTIKNKEIYNSSILFRKNRNYFKKNKEMPKNKVNYINEEEKEEEEDYKNKYFIGIKMDSLKELEEKKEEILEQMKDDIRCRILKGEIGHSEMDNFLNFQKRMNSYRIDLSHSKHFIKLLEQEFTSFEEELKIKEQKKKEEKRINNFFNNMNYDIEKNYYIKKAQKKLFGDFFDFNEKFNINILSPAKEIKSK